MTGITITPREVKISEKLSRGMKNPPKFVLGDYANTKFPDDYFDIVYVNETLSHAKDMRALMQEFYRIIKPGGRVVMADYSVKTRNLAKRHKPIIAFLIKNAGGYGILQQNPGEISRYLSDVGFLKVKEVDWSKYTMPTYNRLRKIARPLAWIRPESKLAPYFVNAVMASHGYSELFEAGLFRYIVYSAQVPVKKGSAIANR